MNKLAPNKFPLNKLALLPFVVLVACTTQPLEPFSLTGSCQQSCPEARWSCRARGTSAANRCFRSCFGLACFRGARGCAAMNRASHSRAATRQRRYCAAVFDIELSLEEAVVSEKTGDSVSRSSHRTSNESDEALCVDDNALPASFPSRYSADACGEFRA